MLDVDDDMRSLQADGESVYWTPRSTTPNAVILPPQATDSVAHHETHSVLNHTEGGTLSDAPSVLLPIADSPVRSPSKASPNGKRWWTWRTKASR